MHYNELENSSEALVLSLCVHTMCGHLLLRRGARYCVVVDYSCCTKETFLPFVSEANASGS